MHQHPDYAAAGTPWTLDEEHRVIGMIAMDRTIEEIAAGCKRTPGAIRARIPRIAVRMVDRDGQAIDDVCAKLKLHPTDIEVERNRALKSMQMRMQPQNETMMSILRDIRDVLRRLEERL
jgi:hypothetical protein